MVADGSLFGAEVMGTSNLTNGVAVGVYLPALKERQQESEDDAREQSNLTAQQGQDSTEDEDEPSDGRSVTLRPYQQAAKKAIFRELHPRNPNRVKSTLVVMSTGTGKSPVIASVTRDTIDWGRKVLVLSHREELIDQLARHIGRLSVFPLIEKANERAIGKLGTVSNCVIGSVQTLKGDRLQQWPRTTFDLILSDEAHHGTSQTWSAIIDHFANARHVGFTATPDRLDGKNLGRLFQSVAYEYSLSDAVNDPAGPFLARPIVDEVETNIDLSSLDIRAGDYVTSQLEEVVQKNLGMLVNETKARIGDRRTICFTPDVRSAESMSLALRDIGIDARFVSYKTPKNERRALIKAFRNGEFQVLCNATLLGEGVDVPEVSCVVIARPTASRALYAQFVGRCLRPFEGKEFGLVIDFAFNSDKPLVSPVELYDNSALDASVIERAKQKVRSGEENDPLQAIQKAQAEIEFEITQRIKIRERQSRAQSIRYDPLANVCDVLGIAKSNSYDWLNADPATEKQLATLAKFKIEVREGLTKGEANRVIGEVISRMKRGMGTHRQVSLAISLGAESNQARAMSREEISAFIGAKLGNRAQRNGEAKADRAMAQAEARFTAGARAEETLNGGLNGAQRLYDFYPDD